jgi:hypothetical protein
LHCWVRRAMGDERDCDPRRGPTFSGHTDTAVPIHETARLNSAEPTTRMRKPRARGRTQDVESNLARCTESTGLAPPHRETGRSDRQSDFLQMEGPTTTCPVEVDARCASQLITTARGDPCGGLVLGASEMPRRRRAWTSLLLSRRATSSRAPETNGVVVSRT